MVIWLSNSFYSLTKYHEVVIILWVQLYGISLHHVVLSGFNHDFWSASGSCEVFLTCLMVDCLSVGQRRYLGHVSFITHQT